MPFYEDFLSVRLLPSEAVLECWWWYMVVQDDFMRTVSFRIQYRCRSSVKHFHLWQLMFIEVPLILFPGAEEYCTGLFLSIDVCCPSDFVFKSIWFCLQVEWSTVRGLLTSMAYGTMGSPVHAGVWSTDRIVAAMTETDTAVRSRRNPVEEIIPEVVERAAEADDRKSQRKWWAPTIAPQKLLRLL